MRQCPVFQVCAHPCFGLDSDMRCATVTNYCQGLRSQKLLIALTAKSRSHPNKRQMTTNLFHHQPLSGESRNEAL